MSGKPEATEAERLTARQLAFVTNYVVSNGNSAESARKAGYAHPDVQGSRMLANVKIQQAIEQRQAKLQVQHDYTIADWLREVIADRNAAKADGSHSAVAQFDTLLGRHIGALQEGRPRSQMEASFWNTLETLAGQAAATQAAGRLASHAGAGVRALPDEESREAGEAGSPGGAG